MIIRVKLFFIVRNIKAPEGDGNYNPRLIKSLNESVRNIKAPEGDGN